MKKGEVPPTILVSTLWTLGVILKKWTLFNLMKINQINPINFLIKNPPTLGLTKGDGSGRGGPHNSSV
jgi:hypothetical protein